MKKNNSKGCANDGYCLSAFTLDEHVVHCPDIIKMFVGGERDDALGEEYRIQVGIETKRQMLVFDLEDFITQVRILCPQLFEV